MADELSFFGVSSKWIKPLWSSLRKIQTRRKDELAEINKILYNDPLEIAEFYIEPDCQDLNTADHHEEDDYLSVNPVMEKIDAFFRKKKINRGDNQMFILADAGMGKTALLTMLKLMHLNAFWPQGRDCIFKKLGPKTLKEIEEIKNQRETILLLDSLDEDRAAYGRVKERLLEILRVTQHFAKVMITCRTQFFPKSEEDTFRRPGFFRIEEFRCPVKYLSFFTDAKVEQYLEKRFPNRFIFLKNKKKIIKAQEVIRLMGSLRCRPMLLSYIEDLMESPLIDQSSGEYHVYDALMDSWLNREKGKVPDISKEKLMKACIILAMIMQMRGLTSISEEELDELIEKIKTVMPVKKLEIKGRSLINRNSEGDYRFSHYTIQEFCVAKGLFEKPVFKNPQGRIKMTDFIVRQMVALKKSPNFSERLDFKGMNLSKMDLSGLDLSGADFEQSDLREVKLIGTNLTEANLKDVNFVETSLAGSLFKNYVGMSFAYIPAGTFMMGSPEDEPNRNDNEQMHEVTLTNGFYLQTTQVTVGQWRCFSDETGYKTEAEAEDGAYGYVDGEWEKDKKIYWDHPGFDQSDDHPVTCVSWNDVQAFIEWLNKKEGNTYRLPTEAEWEYACRAGTETPFAFGKCLTTDDANYNGNYPLEGCPKGEFRQKTTPAGTLSANTWGLYDMHGNLWEWCQDWYGDYSTEAVVDPTGRSEGSDRVRRGGSFGFGAGDCRSACRNYWLPVSRFDYLGFRLSRSITL